MSTVTSLKYAGTPAERVLLTAVDADFPTSAPSTPTDGWAFHGGDYLHVYAEMDTFTAVTVTPWYYSSIAGLWFPGNAINLTTTCNWAIVEVRGEERVFFVLTAQAGGPGTFKLWGGYSFGEPGRDG